MNDTTQKDELQNATDQERIVSPAEAVSSQQPVQPPARNRALSRRVLVMVLLLAIGIAAAMCYVWRSSTPAKEVAATVRESRPVLLAAKPQFWSDNSVAGVAEYDPRHFEEISTLPKIQESAGETLKNIDKNKVVVFTGNILGFDGAGLYLYDIAAGKTFRIAGGGNSPRIMSDHFIVYGSSQQKQDGMHFGFELLDLQTGEKTTITSGNMLKYANSSCCSVSPDGFKLAIPRKDALDVWDIRTRETKSFAVALDPLSRNFPTDAAFYAAAPYFSETSYPTPAWLDNDTLLFADGTPTSIRQEGGSINKDPVPNTVQMLDTVTGEVRKLNGSEGLTYDVHVAMGGARVFLWQSEQLVEFDPRQNAKVGAPIPAGSWNMINREGKVIYRFPTLFGADAYSAYNIETATAAAFNPVPDGLDPARISQILPEAWIDHDLMLVKITDVHSMDNAEYEGIYSTSANKTLHYTKVK